MVVSDSAVGFRLNLLSVPKGLKGRGRDGALGNAEQCSEKGWGHVSPLSHQHARPGHSLRAVPVREVGVRSGSLPRLAAALSSRTSPRSSDLGVLRDPSFFPAGEGGEFSRRPTVRTKNVFSPACAGNPCVTSSDLPTINRSFDGRESLSRLNSRASPGHRDWRSSYGTLQVGAVAHLIASKYLTVPYRGGSSNQRLSPPNRGFVYPLFIGLNGVTPLRFPQHVLWEAGTTLNPTLAPLAKVGNAGLSVQP